MVLTTNFNPVGLAIALSIALSIPAYAQAKGSLIKGCDGSICVLGRFNGQKWVTSTEKDQRSDKASAITYSGFQPQTITIYTGEKALIWDDGELTVNTDDRPYKVPSASAIAK